jgi:hypothetical protein
MDDDLFDKLRQAGIPVGEWSETKPGAKAAPLKRQREILERVKALLETQLEQDRVKRAELHETLNRLKHGGGM